MSPKADASAPSASNPSSENSFVETPSYRFAWGLLNLSAVSMTASSALLLIQSPIRTLLLHASKGVAPISFFKESIYTTAKLLYSGTTVLLPGVTFRSAYSMSAKTNKAVAVESKEEALIFKDEQHQKFLYDLKYIGAVSLGDIVIGQIPTSLSDYKKLGIIPPAGSVAAASFKWYTPHNLYQLMVGNFITRYTSALLTFSALCIVEPKVATYLTTVSPEYVRFVSGGISGMGVAIINYPFTSFIDYTQTKTRLDNGKLINQPLHVSIMELITMIRANPEAAARNFFTNAATQVPLRMLSRGAAFSIVSGVCHLLGEEPLREVIPAKYVPSSPVSVVGFFNKFLENNAPKPAALEQENDKNPEQRNKNSRVC